MPLNKAFDGFGLLDNKRVNKFVLCRIFVALYVAFVIRKSRGNSLFSQIWCDCMQFLSKYKSFFQMAQYVKMENLSNDFFLFSLFATLFRLSRIGVDYYSTTIENIELKLFYIIRFKLLNTYKDT